MFPTNHFNFPKGANIFYKFISGGYIQSCVFDPALPSGIGSSLDEIKGRVSPDISTNPTITYSVECKNQYSLSNKLYFYAAVIEKVKANAIKASFWVPIITGSMDCKEKYDPFFNKDLLVSTEMLVNIIQHPYSEAVKWEGLGSKFTEYWGAVFEGYITVLSTGLHEFHIRSQHGVWIEINGLEVVSAPGCRQFNDLLYESVDFNFEAGQPYPIRILYFHNGEGSGLEITYNLKGQSPRPLPIDELGYGK